MACPRRVNSLSCESGQKPCFRETPTPRRRSPTVRRLGKGPELELAGGVDGADPGSSAPGDLFGAAVNWGEVNELSFGKGLDDQYTLELFYRWQLTPRFALTGDYQYLKDPALNPLEDSIHVFAVRGRFAL